jgi:Bacterial PH domain
MMPSTSSKKSSRGNLIHEDTPRWNMASKIARVPVTLVAVWYSVNAAMWIASGDLPGAVIPPVFAISLDLMVFFFIAPRKYQIFDDRLRVAFGRPFAYNFPLSKVKGVRPHSIWGLEYLFSFFFCTSGEAVEILHSASSFMISPANRDLFIRKLNEALEKAKTDTHV